MRGEAEKNAGCAKVTESGERTGKGVGCVRQAQRKSHMQGFTEEERGFSGRGRGGTLANMFRHDLPPITLVDLLYVVLRF